MPVPESSQEKEEESEKPWENDQSVPGDGPDDDLGEEIDDQTTYTQVVFVQGTFVALISKEENPHVHTMRGKARRVESRMLTQARQ